MLTVWRKLYVEFDEMDPPGPSEKFNIVDGISSAITSNTLTAQGNPAWEPNCMVGGVLDPDDQSPSDGVDFVDGNTWEVVSNTSYVATVQIDYTSDKSDNDNQNGRDDAGEVFPMSGFPPPTSFGINTDDADWKGTLNPPSPTSVIASLNGYYDDAYILCEALPTGNTHPTCPFTRNTASQFPTIDVPGGSDFWNVCVGFAYEHNLHKHDMDGNCADHSFYTGDNDPEDEGVPAGYMGCVYGYAPAGKRCLIYCEIQRDRPVPGGINQTIAHEIGHRMGLEHAEYDPNDPFNAEKDGIMRWKKHLSITCNKAWMDLVWGHTSPDRFSWQDIDDLRSANAVQ